MFATTHQASLFDVGAAEPQIGELGSTVVRTDLGRGAWVDFRPNWITGTDDLFTELAASVDWRAERRAMYDRVVDVPRLTCFFGDNDELPHPTLTAARAAVGTHYRSELREPFTTAGLCYYRDGSDSVAWHGDTIGRSRTEDTMVAILSLGDARPLLLRPRGGGPSIRYSVGHGDLLVMGGSCQRTFEHAVPKSTKPVGPRISVQFRPHDVR